MPPVDFDPTEPLPGDRPAEAWVVKLTLNITRLAVPPGGQAVQRGAIMQEELGEGATPGEAYRTAVEKLRPLIKAYRLEGGPLPLASHRDES